MQPSIDHKPQAVLGIIIILLLLIIGLVATTIIMASVPPVSRDALTHHLAVPKIYLSQGRMLELPEIVPSYFPMNIDLLFLIPLIWENDILPKHIHMLFGILTSGLIYAYLRRRLSHVYGLLGGLLYLSLPIVIQLSITVYVDLGLAFFSTAALFCILEWKRAEFRLPQLFLSGIFCGLAMGTKYNGLVVFILLSFVVPFLANQQKTKSYKENRGAARRVPLVVYHVVIFVGTALLIFSPWAIRNYIWTGNPIFPLYDVLFNPQNPFIETRMNAFAIRRFVYGENLWETLLVPLRIFFQGQDDVPGLFDGRLNPFLLPLVVLGIFKTRHQPSGLQSEKALWSSFAFLFILIVFFTRDMRIRYIMPAVPPLVIVSVMGIRNLVSYSSRIKTNLMRHGHELIIVLSAALIFAPNAVYVFQKWKVVKPIEYLSGRIDRDAYITRYRPEYTVIQYANRHLTKEHRILCVFLGNRRYYFDIATFFMEWPQFEIALNQARNASQFDEELAAKGISHVVIGLEGVDFWARRTLSIDKQRMLQQWIAEYLETVIEENGFALFGRR